MSYNGKPKQKGKAAGRVGADPNRTEDRPGGGLRLSPVEPVTPLCGCDIKIKSWGGNIMPLIFLGNNIFTKVDDCDFEKISAYKWRIQTSKQGKSYVVNGYRDFSGKYCLVLMHRLIMSAPEGNRKIVIDHKNGDGLDNTRDNLRICSQKENTFNRKKPNIVCTSKYLGVSYKATRSLWRSFININGKRKCLGRFSDEYSAAVAYDNAAKSLVGDFARTNILSL